MRFNIPLTALLVLGLCGLLLIGSGITGNVVQNYSLPQFCKQNTECNMDKVCCYYQGADQGVCSSQTICNQIVKSLQGNYISSNDLKNIIERPENNSYGTEIFFGSVLLLIFFILLYAMARSMNKKIEKSTKKLVRKKK